MNARARTQKQKNPWVGEPFPTCKYTKKGAFAADNDKIVGKSVYGQLLEELGQLREERLFNHTIVDLFFIG
jgi:hypothetical protein